MDTENNVKKYDEKQDSCIISISKYLRTRYLLITTGKKEHYSGEDWQTPPQCTKLVSPVMRHPCHKPSDDTLRGQNITSVAFLPIIYNFNVIMKKH